VRRWVLCLALGSLAPGVVASQADSSSQSSCISRLPSSVFTRVTIYLEADAIDTTGREMLPHVDLLMQSVATHLRRSLGTEGGRLPAADSVVDWYHLGASLVLAVYPDGRFAWRPEPERLLNDGGGRPGRQLIERALVVARDSAERVYTPDSAIRDSMLFRVSYTRPDVSEGGKVEPLHVRVAFPVFSVPVPWMTPALAIQQPRVRYPAESRDGGVEGNLILQFVIDTAGRAVMSTVRDLWPSRQPRLTGDKARYYQEFVEAAIDAVERTRFQPARIGGCPINQLVQLPFAFQLRR
jgi:hypothetical protein